MTSSAAIGSVVLSAVAEARLYAAIAHRHSDREPFADMAVPQVVRAQLREAAQELRVGLRRYGSPKMLLGAGYGVPGAATLRRPLADVLI